MLEKGINFNIYKEYNIENKNKISKKESNYVKILLMIITKIKLIGSFLLKIADSRNQGSPPDKTDDICKKLIPCYLLKIADSKKIYIYNIIC